MYNICDGGREYLVNYVSGVDANDMVVVNDIAFRIPLAFVNYLTSITPVDYPETGRSVRFDIVNQSNVVLYKSRDGDNVVCTNSNTHDQIIAEFSLDECKKMVKYKEEIKIL